MPTDEFYLSKIVRLLEEAGIESILVGSTAAVIHDAPVMTEDFDFFVRDTALIRSRIKEFAARLKADSRPERIGNLTDAIRVRGGEVPIDFLFAIGGEPKFESVRSRATRHPAGGRRVWIASLEDVIASKKAADRPKDRLAVPVLEQTLAMKRSGEGQAAESKGPYRRRPRRAATRRT